MTHERLEGSLGVFQRQTSLTFFFLHFASDWLSESVVASLDRIQVTSYIWKTKGPSVGNICQAESPEGL